MQIMEGERLGFDCLEARLSLGLPKPASDKSLGIEDSVLGILSWRAGISGGDKRAIRSAPALSLDSLRLSRRPQPCRPPRMSQPTSISERRTHPEACIGMLLPYATVLAVYAPNGKSCLPVAWSGMMEMVWQRHATEIDKLTET